MHADLEDQPEPGHCAHSSFEAQNYRRVTRRVMQHGSNGVESRQFRTSGAPVPTPGGGARARASRTQHAPALSHSCRSDCMPENHAIVAAGDAGRAATSLRMERVARGATVVSSGGGG